MTPETATPELDSTGDAPYRWGRLAPFGWYACDQPERIPDVHTLFHVPCDACAIALRAAASIPPRPGQFTGWYREAPRILALLEKP